MRFGQREERVDLVVVAHDRHRHAGLLELRRVRLALGEQRVVAGQEDPRGRQPLVARRPQRSGVRMDTVGRIRHVVVPEPRHVRRVQDEVRLLVLRVVVRRQIAVDDRVDQDLQRDVRTALTRPQRHDRREVAARAVAGDDDRTAELLGRPLGRRVRVVGRRGEAMLRREAVVDADDAGPRLVREVAHSRVPGVEVADDPAAPVEVHDGPGRVRHRLVDPRRDPAGGTGDLHVAHRLDVGPGARQLGQDGRESARLLRGHRGERRTAALGHHVQQLLRLRVDRQRRSSSSWAADHARRRRYAMARKR